MKLLHIIGADLSKETIDFAIYSGPHLKVDNNLSGFQKFIKWLEKEEIDRSEMIIVMEHTGLYCYQLTQFLEKHEISFTKRSALDIKRSMGLVRGKNDKLDAIRIARYGFEKRDTLVADRPVPKTLERLQMLNSTRERLVKNRAGMLAALKEYQYNCGLKKDDLIMQSQLELVRNYDRQISKLDEAIMAIIETDKVIKKNYQLLQSIRGIGKVIAAYAIVRTGNFTRFSKARKFACYCGTAPFENSSGTSIRGKTKVSHLADKRMKTLLDLGAMSAIQWDPELRKYYLKRLQAGKSEISTRNVVRNKLVYRMFAIIKRQTPFVDNYLKSA